MSPDPSSRPPQRHQVNLLLFNCIGDGNFDEALFRSLVQPVSLSLSVLSLCLCLSLFLGGSWFLVEEASPEELGREEEEDEESGSEVY